VKTAKSKLINWRDWPIAKRIAAFDWRKLQPRQLRGRLKLRNQRQIKGEKPQPLLQRRSVIWLGVCALLLIGLLICVLSYRHTANLLLAEDTANRWAGESVQRFTEVSCFFEQDEAPTAEKLLQFSQTVDQQLLAASLEAEEGGKLWTYTYAAMDSLSISGDYGSATATVFGVAGDYFLFHPLRLRDGSYISASDLMDDRVVLDEELAWRIYGSADLAGLSISINGVPYLIAGVITRDKDRYNNQTYPDEPTIYLSYTAFAKISEKPISSYEIVLPNPISNFGLDLVKNNFPLGDHGQALEETGRFSIEPIAKVLFNYSQRTIKDNEIAYPYWENAARLVENHLAMLLLFSFLLALFPAASFIYLIVKEIKHVKHHFKKPRQDI
jgi:hypothetical protein